MDKSDIKRIKLCEFAQSDSRKPEVAKYDFLRSNSGNYTEI